MSTITVLCHSRYDERKRYICVKYWLIVTELHGVMYLKNGADISSAVAIPNLG
jgi:hypothetical protein